MSSGIYIDVGANHPSSLSNSFLFYRSGLSGVVIEPNQELLKLHRFIRPKDIAIGIGCGSHSVVKTFHHFTTPVLSSFVDQNISQSIAKNFRIWRTESIPILPLDLALSEFRYGWIYFLSIDTKGNDFNVVLGAVKTLENTLYLCIEVGNLENENIIVNWIQKKGFLVVKRFGCNLLAINTNPHFKQFLKP